jgi:phenylalanyl-tRNA synthetase beta chain
MRVPLSWLRDYVDFDLPPGRLAERLTMLGMEVSSIEVIGEDWHSVVVGELLEVAPHPNSQRLSLTRVRVADNDQPLSIVCGATNIAVGQRVPVALPGAVLPGERSIGVTTIAGVESQGMLCSGAELGITADADGILILGAAGAGGATGGDGVGELALGKPLAEVAGDVVLDIDVKPNRGDALSLIGLAREVAAITGGQVRWPAIAVAESGDSTSDHLFVQVDDAALCPRFVGRYVDGLSIGPSPLKVQMRLSAAGMRPVSNAVDASNYVMLELGKPIHVFDSSAVQGGRIIVRRARAGESIETLDHVARELTTDTLVIADERGPVGIAGVMGGASSEVGDTTTAAIIESAVFDPVSIRRTAFHFALRSEASLRFEKGQESRLARVGADRTAQLLAQWAGGRVATGVIDTNPVDEQPHRVPFRPARVSRLLGEEIPADEMKSALARVGIAAEPGGAGELVAVVPPHRRDITIEADVTEEIIRVRGYEELPPQLPDTQMPPYRPDPHRLVNQVRDLLAGRGLAEALTNGLIGPVDHARLGYAADDPATIRVANPVSVDHSEMRRSLLPSMLAVVDRNERQRQPDLAIYEVGTIHEWRVGKPWQQARLGILLCGNLRAPSWYEAARAAGIEDLKAVATWLLERLGVRRVEFRQPAAIVAGIEHPGRTALVAVLDDDDRWTEVGRLGELDPRYVAACGVRAEHVNFASLDLALIEDLARPVAEVRELAQLPPLELDIAIVVGRDVQGGKVADVIRAHAGPRLDRLTLFDRYQGPPLDSDEISLAYRLRFQPNDEGPTVEQLADLTADIERAVGDELGGRVRSG